MANENYAYENLEAIAEKHGFPIQTLFQYFHLECDNLEDESCEASLELWEDEDIDEIWDEYFALSSRDKDEIVEAWREYILETRRAKRASEKYKAFRALHNL